jgi:hypothetical protein
MAISTAFLVFKENLKYKINIQHSQNDCAYTFSNLPLHRDTETPNTNQYYRFKSNG